MVVLFNSEPPANKFYIIYYYDPITDENKFHFADTFELACNRAESIIKELSKETPIKIRIFEEVLAYIKHERDEDKFKGKEKRRIKW